MTSRYDGREIRTNIDQKYREIFKKRNVQFINQYMTPELKYPTATDMAELTNYSHVWKLGDRFYKLADEYYKDSTLWWVIAWYNRTPTEAQVNLGDIVNIPMPLEKILQILEV